MKQVPGLIQSTMEWRGGFWMVKVRAGRLGALLPDLPDWRSGLRGGAQPEPSRLPGFLVSGRQSGTRGSASLPSPPQVAKWLRDVAVMLESTDSVKDPAAATKLALASNALLDLPEDAKCMGLGQCLKDSPLLSKESALMMALRSGTDASITKALEPILSEFSKYVTKECTGIDFSVQTAPALAQLASAAFDQEKFSEVMQLSNGSKDKILTLQLGIASQLLSTISAIAHVEAHMRIVKAKPDDHWSTMWTRNTLDLFRRLRTWRATLKASLEPERTKSCFEAVVRAGHVDLLDGAVRLDMVSDSLFKVADALEKELGRIFGKQLADLIQKIAVATPLKWKRSAVDLYSDKEACMELLTWDKGQLQQIGPLTNEARAMGKMIRHLHGDGHPPALHADLVKRLAELAQDGVATFCFAFAVWHMSKAIPGETLAEKITDHVTAVKGKFSAHKVRPDGGWSRRRARARVEGEDRDREEGLEEAVQGKGGRGPSKGAAKAEEEEEEEEDCEKEGGRRRAEV